MYSKRWEDPYILYTTKKVQKDLKEYDQLILENSSLRNIKIELLAEDIMESNLVIPIIFSIEETALIKKFVNHPNFFIICIDDMNQSIFKEDVEQNAYIINSKEELGDVFNILDKVLFNSKNEFYSQVAKISNKNKLELSTDLQREYIEKILQAKSIEELARSIQLINAGFKLTSIADLYFNKDLKKYIHLFNLLNQQIVLQADISIPKDLIYWVEHCLNFNIHFQSHDMIQEKTDLPFILTTENFTPLKTNEKFSKLNLKLNELNQLSHNKRILIDKRYYRVRIIPLENNEKLFLFFDVKEDFIKNTDSGEDVGIISSSIAHELKNPLAGILAATECIMLDELDHQVKESLIEINNSVLRCKKLVEIFLSFSKQEIYCDKINESDSNKEIFNQAFDLLRFRLIENNIRLNFKYLEHDKFFFEGDLNTFPMLIYLLFNELMTQLSHLSLVQDNKLEVFDLMIEEDESQIKISFPDIKIAEFASKIDSPLLNHLLRIQKLDFFFEDKALFFKGVLPEKDNSSVVC